MRVTGTLGYHSSALFLVAVTVVFEGEWHTGNNNQRSAVVAVTVIFEGDWHNALFVTPNTSVAVNDVLNNF